MTMNPNTERCLLLDHPERLVLAGLLESRTRPDDIEPEIWRQLTHAELSGVPFSIIATLCEEFTATVILDGIRWPNPRPR